MARVIDVEVDNDRIKIDFPYDRDLVEVMRSLPDRSFDNRTKCWFVPLKHLEYVIERLEGYHFKFSPRLRKFRTDDDESGSVKPAVPTVPEGTWTVSRLNQAARAALQERFDESVWVVGELQDYDKNRNSNYSTYFFDLVERPFAGATEVARIKAVMFERHRNTVEKRLADSDIELSDGVAVRLCGTIDLYSKNGRYQLRVEDVDPAYTAGEIELNRERIYRALQQKGIETNNLERSWPACPMNIGLITSYESDAYNDFIHQLRASGLGCSVTVHNANVQGSNTEPSVLRALAYFREHADQFDVVALVRGGGSRSDLAYFDTEKIGEAICGHTVKIIAGIGHHRDTCLVDMIAESTKTPTAAASRITDQVRGFVDELDTTYEQIARRARRRVDAERRTLMRQAGRLERRVMRHLQDYRRRQVRLTDMLVERIRSALRRRRRSVEVMRERLEQLSRRRTEQRRDNVERARHQLSIRRMRRRLDRRRRRLDRLAEQLRKSALRDTEENRRQLEVAEQKLELLDPRQILERGYALVSHDDNIVYSRDQIPPGDDFDVMLGDGLLRARRLADQTAQTEPEADEAKPEPVD